MAQLWGFHDQRPAAEQLLRLRQHLEQQDPWPCTEEPRYSNWLPATSSQWLNQFSQSKTWGVGNSAPPPTHPVL